jgi:hypothetical protein
MNRPLILLAVLCLPLLTGCGGSAPALAEPADAQEPEDDAPPPPPDFVRDVAPVLTKYCLGCHSGANPRGGAALDALRGTNDANERRLWQRVAVNLHSGDMPPPGKPRPTPAELGTLNAWLEVVSRSGCGEQGPDRVTLRRLNRVEYNNTVRDLLGVNFRPADDFPKDDVGHGFDNIGDVLSLPPILLEKYLAAAEALVDAAFRSDETRKRIMNPAPDDVVPLASRAITYTVREPARKVLRTSLADAPAPLDSRGRELEHAYNVLRAFADRAYHRPVTHDELLRLQRFVEVAQKNGDGGERGLRLAMQAVLVSPHFLFRVEPGDASAQVNDYELATRLSYFLWSSMPDDELFRHAARGTLRQGDTLASQVRRMLGDNRSRALAENFAGQWLQTRGLAELAPDPVRFPDFDEPLRTAMVRETETFFDAVVREDRSVLDFLDADFTFVNERLARHYGLSGVRGEEFRRVSLAGTARGGVLTQAGVLAVTSNPTGTSPVKRGKWVLENLLGDPPPPPPPGVDSLAEGPEGAVAGSLRRRLERHRSDPACASCHQRLDPLGFGLENFDAVGAWRDRDGASPIDASGAFPDGAAFDGPAELRAQLRARREAFARCLTEKLLTYALGRGVDRCDRPPVEAIVRRLARGNYRFSALVQAIVRSEPFQSRGGGRSTR